jgi:hypothetical protein
VDPVDPDSDPQHWIQVPVPMYQLGEEFDLRRCIGDGVLERHFFVKVSAWAYKLESSQTRVFVWFSTFVFRSYKMLFLNRLEYFCFAHFFVWFFKTRVDDDFLYNLPVEETVNNMEQKTRVKLSN